MKRNTLICLLVFVFTGNLLAWNNPHPDTLDRSPLNKGTNLVGISGFVSSSNLEHSSQTLNTAQFGNSYRFDVRLGKFIANKNLLGIQFFMNKVNLIGVVESSADVASVGPFYRLYLGEKPDFAVFLLASAMWSNYEAELDGLLGASLLDQDISASGIYSSLGLGVTYIMSARVAFEVSVEYSFARYWGELNNHIILDVDDVEFALRGIKFSVGFSVLFGKLKQDE